MTPFRFAHLSDLHLFARPRLAEWTWRRWLGCANWYLRRRRRHRPEGLLDSILRAGSLPLDAVLLTGDLGQTGVAAEYRAARGALAPFSHRGVPVLAVAGNHDLYGRRADPALDSLRRDLRLGLEVDELGVARVGPAEILLCEQARRNRWIGSGGEPAPGLAASLARRWRSPVTVGRGGHGRADPPAPPPAAPLRLAIGHYPLRLADGRPLPGHRGLRGSEGWPALLDACGVSGYFCGHLHRKFAVDLTASCRQYCAGSATAGGGVDLYLAGPEGLAPA